MKLIENKLKVIDIDYHDDILYTPGLFFDVIEHYFEDQFLVIKWYKKIRRRKHSRGYDLYPNG